MRFEHIGGALITSKNIELGSYWNKDEFISKLVSVPMTMVESCMLYFNPTWRVLSIFNKRIL